MNREEETPPVTAQEESGVPELELHLFIPFTICLVATKRNPPPARKQNKTLRMRNPEKKPRGENSWYISRVARIRIIDTALWRGSKHW